MFSDSLWNCEHDLFQLNCGVKWGTCIQYIPSRPALSSLLPCGRFLIKQDWIISLAKVINVGNSPSSYLPTLAWCYPDPPLPQHTSHLPASQLFLSQWMILIAYNEAVMVVFIYDEASRKILMSCGYQRKSAKAIILRAIKQKIICILVHDINLSRFLVYLLAFRTIID